MRVLWVTVAAMLTALGCLPPGDDEDGDDRDGGPAGAGPVAEDPPGYFRTRVDPSSCDDFTPCESDLNGDWSLRSAVFCADVSTNFDRDVFDDPACAGSLRAIEAPMTGTLNIAPSSCSIDVRFQVKAIFDITAACIAALGGPSDIDQACADLDGALSIRASPGSSIEAAGCAAGSSVCTCTIRSPDTPVIRSGQCRPDLPEDACVSGDWLEIKPEPEAANDVGHVLLRFERQGAIAR